MPTILYISPHFPPSAASGAFRALGFAKHLPQFGWELSFIASGPVWWEPNDPCLLKQVPQSTRVHYVEFPLDIALRFDHQLMQKLKIKGWMDVWNTPALKLCNEEMERERRDLVFTSGPPHNVHLIGRALQKRYGVPWVADFRDPWCSWGGETPYVNNGFLLEYCWERKVFKHADLIVANTANTAKMLRRVFPDAAKRIVSVPNGYDPIPSTGYFQAVGRDRITLLHTGSIYAGRNPLPIVEALRALSLSNRLSGNRAVFRLIGQGKDEKLRGELYSAGLTPWVELVDPIPHADIANEMRAADLLVLLDSPGRRIGVPAKVYEYIGAHRPVLALAEEDSDTATLLQNGGVNHRVVSDWQDLEGIKNAVLQLLSQAATSDLAAFTTHELTRESRARELSRMLAGLLC